MPLFQSDVIPLLLKCDGGKDVEEVLLAYLHSKYASGNSDAQVDAKFRRLAAYLRFRNQTRFLIDNQATFQRLSLQISCEDANHCLLSSPSVDTEPGKEAWAKATHGSLGRTFKLATSSRNRDENGRRNRDNTSGEVNLPDYNALSLTTSSSSCLNVLPPNFWVAGADSCAEAKPEGDDDNWKLPLPPPAYRMTKQPSAETEPTNL
ncbi:hypothetical protein T439DRAFT_360066 [Meredithblackwellia eburnea MCA 4105]